MYLSQYWCRRCVLHIIAIFVVNRWEGYQLYWYPITHAMYIVTWYPQFIQFREHTFYYESKSLYCTHYYTWYTLQHALQLDYYRGLCNTSKFQNSSLHSKQSARIQLMHVRVFAKFWELLKLYSRSSVYNVEWIVRESASAAACTKRLGHSLPAHSLREEASLDHRLTSCPHCSNTIETIALVYCSLPENDVTRMHTLRCSVYVI